jgi:hypothetical protein
VENSISNTVNCPVCRTILINRDIIPPPLHDDDGNNDLTPIHIITMEDDNLLNEIIPLFINMNENRINRERRSFSNILISRRSNMNIAG